MVEQRNDQKDLEAERPVASQGPEEATCHPVHAGLGRFLPGEGGRHHDGFGRLQIPYSRESVFDFERAHGTTTAHSTRVMLAWSPGVGEVCLAKQGETERRALEVGRSP